MPELIPAAPGTSYVCDRCGLPAVQRDGRWEHAEAADAAFCQLVMWAGRARAAQEAINDLGAGPHA